MKKGVGPGAILFLPTPLGEMPEGFYVLLSRPDDILIDLAAVDECHLGGCLNELEDLEIFYGTWDELDLFLVLRPVQAPPPILHSRPPPGIPYRPYADIASLN